MRRIGERILPAVTQEESLSGHDVQNNSSSVTAAAGDPLSAFAGLQNSGSSVTTAAPTEQPDETKAAVGDPQGTRKKKA